MTVLSNFPFSSRLSFLAVVVFGLLVIAGPAAGKRLAATKGDLEEIQQRIKKIVNGLKNKQLEEKSLKKDMLALEGEIKQLQAREKVGKKTLARLREETDGQEKLIEQLREKSRLRREMVKKRLGAMYREGQTHLLRLLFSGNSPDYIAEEYYLLKRVVHHDRELLDQYRLDQAELNERLAELTDLREKTRAELENLEKGRQTLAEGKRAKTKILARLQSQQARMNNELASLKEKAARLQSLVKRLEREKAPEYTEKAGVFASQKGHLPWPVKGSVKVGFGTCRLPSLGTLYDCQGIEIETPKGRPILASWNGTVIFAKPFKGYGNLIIVDHGDKYYTLYAQASRLLKAVGEKVKMGEVIAYSGFEGAESVYFEIRHRGTPEDPLAWLKPSS
jgi:septal ring factor EnvC (AmiA/AmiB activator)